MKRSVTSIARARGNGAAAASRPAGAGNAATAAKAAASATGAGPASRQARDARPRAAAPDNAAPAAAAGPAVTAAASAEAAAETDGRRRRGNTSRARIVEAIGRLIQQGNPSPGAARVAELAGVSLRTVFRHFEDMDSLYREISLSIRDRVLPAVLRPYRSDTWQGRLDELLERRIALFEAILPYKLAGDLRRHQSPYLEQDHAEHIQMEQASLEPLLPPALLADRRWTNALHMATGFQAWRTLRRDLDLDVPEAKATLKRGVAALLAAADPRPEAAARNTTTPANAGKEGPKA